jgi:hypothetical protein
MFVIGMGLGLHWLSGQSSGVRRVVYVGLVLAIGMNYLVVAAKMFDLVGENASMIPWEDRILSGPLERI